MSVNRVQLWSHFSVKRVCFGKLQTSLCITIYIEVHPPGNMALAKILHQFDNTRIEEQQLGEMDSKVSCVVRDMFGLYPKTTDKVFFIGRLKGVLV